MKAKFLVVPFLAMLVAVSSPLWSAAPLENVFQDLGGSSEVVELASPFVTPFTVTLQSLAIDPGPVCPWASARVCPQFGDCGYEWDGICCTPRCNGQHCHQICIA